ncbi:hypothetical protein Tco_1234679 [Tanacetum coccineum]
MALLGNQIHKRYYNKPTNNNLSITSAPIALNKRQDYLPQNEVVRQGGIRLERADTGKEVKFQEISLTGFRSCTSRSHYQSVSKQTTRYSIRIFLAMSSSEV